MSENKGSGKTFRSMVFLLMVITLLTGVVYNTEIRVEAKAKKDIRDVKALREIIEQQRAQGANIHTELDNTMEYNWNEKTGRLEKINWRSRKLSGWLDVNKLESLKYLDCSYNRLTRLDVSRLNLWKF